MNEEDFKIITDVPERLQGTVRGAVLDWYIKRADKVSILELPKGASRYKIYFDEGAYKGGTEFTLKQSQLTPLNAYLNAAETGWPGFHLKWLEDICEERIKNETEQGDE